MRQEEKYNMHHGDALGQHQNSRDERQNTGG